MKFTIEMNVHELGWSIQSGTLEGFVKNVKSYEDEVRNDKQTASVANTNENRSKVEKVTINQIRERTAIAAKKDRTAVKKLLSEFDAPNVSSLSKEHYEEFYKKVGELID